MNFIPTKLRQCTLIIILVFVSNLNDNLLDKIFFILFYLWLNAFQNSFQNFHSVFTESSISHITFNVLQIIYSQQYKIII